MREIIFRGKRMDNDHWIKGSLIIEPNLPEFKSMYSDVRNAGKSKYLIYPFDAKDGRAIEVFPETVGQYTTFKNKDGKKIYEDDCLEYAGCILLIGWYGYRWGYGIIKGSLMRPPRLLDIVD